MGLPPGPKERYKPLRDLSASVIDECKYFDPVTCILIIGKKMGGNSAQFLLVLDGRERNCWEVAAVS